MTDHERAVMQQALEAMRFALHVGFDESSESQIKKADKASRQHWSAIRAIEAALAQQAEPAAMYETDVQLVARLPEFHLLCVQDSQGTRFVEDQDTEFQTELLPVVTLCAQVNAEGYPRLVSGPLAGDAVYTAPPQQSEPVYYEVSSVVTHNLWMRVSKSQYDEYVRSGWEGRTLHAVAQQNITDSNKDN